MKYCLLALLCFFIFLGKENFAYPSNFSKEDFDERNELITFACQLEKEIETYEFIEEAKLNLVWNQEASQCEKAMLLLKLKNQMQILPGNLLCLVNHLSGSIHGLQPYQIAICDTQGILYQAITSLEPFSTQELLIKHWQQRLKNELDKLLSIAFGEKQHYLQVALQLDSKKEDLPFYEMIEKVEVNLLLNKKAFGQESDKESLECFLKNYLEGEKIPFQLNLQTLDFLSLNPIECQVPPNDLIKRKSNWLGATILALVLTLVAICFFIYHFKRKSKVKINPKSNLSEETNEDPLFKTMTRIDFTKLAESFKNEDPETIALMLSYLEHHKASQILENLDPQKKEEVLKHYVR